jgi:hypothetical protein
MAGLRLPGKPIVNDYPVASVNVPAMSTGTVDNQPNVTPKNGAGEAPGAGC